MCKKKHTFNVPIIIKDYIDVPIFAETIEEACEIARDTIHHPQDVPDDAYYSNQEVIIQDQVAPERNVNLMELIKVNETPFAELPALFKDLWTEGARERLEERCSEEEE